MRTTIYIIIVHFGDPSPTAECLKSVQERITNSKIVLVDNDINPLASYSKSIIHIKNKKNIGFVGGNNIGVKFCLRQGAKDVFLLNNDCFIKKDPIPLLRKNLWKKANTGITGPKIITSENKTWFAGGYIDKNRYTAGHFGFDSEKLETPKNNIDFISGCSMLVKSEVFKKIGFFEEQYFLYYEDVDFSVRAIQAGFNIKYVPKSIVYHKARTKNQSSEYYQERNYLLFVEKKVPFKIKAREIIRIPKSLLEILKEKDEQIKQYRLRGFTDYFKRNFGKYDYRN